MELRQFLDLLSTQIGNHVVRSEADLTRAVEDDVFAPDSKLLGILGFDRDSVRPQHCVRLATGQEKVDFLVGHPGRKWMLELKEPANELGGNEVHQLSAYLEAVNVATDRPNVPLLGVLFNGKRAKVVVNCLHPELNLGHDARRHVVLETGSEPDALVDLFGNLSEQRGPQLRSYARDLAQSWLQEERKRKIRNEVLRLRGHPTDEILGAFVSSSDSLAELDVTTEELHSLWPEIEKTECPPAVRTNASRDPAPPARIVDTGTSWLKLRDLPDGTKRRPSVVRFDEGAPTHVAHWKELCVEVLKWLDRQDRLPNAPFPSAAPRRYFYARTRVHSDGRKMEAPEEVILAACTIYVEQNISAQPAEASQGSLRTRRRRSCQDRVPDGLITSAGRGIL